MFFAGIDAHTRYVVVVLINKTGERVLGPTRVKMDRPASYDQTVTSAGDGGSSSLAEIRFRGKNFALRVAGEGGSSSSGASAQ